MTDHPDIVARLRAYTQHNRPVLASDLKEAADEIERLRSQANTMALSHAEAQLLPHVELAFYKMANEGGQLWAQDVARRNASFSAERLDEFERRLALLESSHRVTRRRLVQAGETLALDNNTTGISEVSKILRGFRDA